MLFNITKAIMRGSSPGEGEQERKEETETEEETTSANSSTPFLTDKLANNWFVRHRNLIETRTMLKSFAVVVGEISQTHLLKSVADYKFVNSKLTYICHFCND